MELTVDEIKLAEDNEAEERNSRIAEFELRTRSMGITEDCFVAQKVAIWEGIWAAKQNGDDIGVSIILFFPLPLSGYTRIVANWDGDRPQYYARVLLDAATSAHQ